MMLAVAGLIAGGGAGFFGVGPVLAAKKAAAPAKPAEHAEKKGEGEGSGAVVHPVENLVLNPAGSNGTRFLMVTATFELKDQSGDEAMKTKEAEVRDRILALLGKKTVEELTDVTQREVIKKETMDAITPLFPKGMIVKVFFPQFVIQ